MRVRALYIIFLLLCFGCKPAENVAAVNKNIKLSDYISMYSNKDFITDNPLIIVNSKPYKLYSELDEDDIKLKEQPIKNLSYFKKKNKYFINKLGKRAYNGIVQIKNKIRLYCGSPCKSDIIIDGKLANFQEYTQLLLNQKYKYFNNIYRLELGNNKYVTITIIETK